MSASIRSDQPSGLDFERIIVDIETILINTLRDDIDSNRTDEYTYAIDYEGDEYMTLEISYFPSEEILDWQEQKQRIHSEKQGTRADRARLTMECTSPKPVDSVSEYLTTTDEYTVVFDKYS